MNIHGQVALVTGGASGLGAATARALAAAGARVAVVDRNAELAAAIATEIGGLALRVDITDTDAVARALDRVQDELGPLRALLNVAGVGGARRMIARDGTAVALDHFKRIIDVNLVGTFDVIRQAAARMATSTPQDDGERGLILCTSSVAAWDGQVGQVAYAASKGALASLTLPLARDLAQHGIRVVTIAPGLFLTPLMAELPEAVQKSLAESIPFPRRLGKPEEFAALVLHAISNSALNGEVVRLDGALRLPPR